MQRKLYLNFTKTKGIIKHVNKIPKKENIEAPIVHTANLDGGKIDKVNIKPTVRRADNIKFVL
jgi:hypothetical protein